MPIDREQWRERFEQLPHWRCPTCDKGHLIPMPEKMVIEETPASAESHSHEAWEPDWIRARFAGFSACSNKDCGGLATISGDSPVDVFVEQDWDRHQETVTHLYVVKSVFPAPLPIKLPGAVPDNIKDAVGMASVLVWPSNEAAGNQLRQVVELFLTEMGIADKGPKGGYIPTHTRIEEFQKADPENGEALLAVKWLGNSSSHPGGLTRDDVLSGFEIIEFVLENKYGTEKAKLKAIIAEILAAKGPAKAKP